MLSLYELKKINTKVTAILFIKEEYSIEGIIRWLMDRGFGFENFEETEKFYVFNQSCRTDFSFYEYNKIEGCNIIVEIGSMDKSVNNRGAELISSIPC